MFAMKTSKNLYLILVLAGLFFLGLGISQAVTEEATFEQIILKSSNWEGHGETININQKGHFTVKTVRFGREKVEKSGILKQESLEELKALVSKDDILSLNDKYTGKTKTSRSWKNYDLAISTDSEKKTISFNSEDDTVPERLKQVVEKIESLVAMALAEK